MTEIIGAIDPTHFREVLGQYPTGVCVVAARPGDGPPVGMAVGSFTSVSLDPPLIAFMPAKSSTTWPRIERVGHFCVNVLAAEQEPICRRFASKLLDKFEGLEYRAAGSGSPILRDVVAWIDCDIQDVVDAGDHYIVIGAVRELQVERPGPPLVFFQGGYGRFHPLSLAAPNTDGALGDQLRHVDMVRDIMEHTAEEIDGTVLATTRLGTTIVVVASASSSNSTASQVSVVGQRLPFVPPGGTVFAAWDGEAEIESWLGETVGEGPPREAARRSIELVRQRGFSVGLISDAQRNFTATLTSLADGSITSDSVDMDALARVLSYDPEELTGALEDDVRIVSAPVFDKMGRTRFALAAHGFRRDRHGLSDLTARVMLAASQATSRCGGTAPSGWPDDV